MRKWSFGYWDLDMSQFAERCMRHNWYKFTSSNNNTQFWHIIINIVRKQTKNLVLQISNFSIKPDFYHFNPKSVSKQANLHQTFPWAYHMYVYLEFPLSLRRDNFVCGSNLMKNTTSYQIYVKLPFFLHFKKILFQNKQKKYKSQIKQIYMTAIKVYKRFFLQCLIPHMWLNIRPYM